MYEPAFPRLAPLMRALRRSLDGSLATILGLLALPFIVALVMGLWPVLLIGLAVFALLVVIGACL